MTAIYLTDENERFEMQEDMFLGVTRTFLNTRKA